MKTHRIGHLSPGLVAFSLQLGSWLVLVLACLGANPALWDCAWREAQQVAAGGTAVLGALLLPYRLKLGKGLLISSLFAFLGLALNHLADQPSLGLFTIIVFFVCAYLLIGLGQVSRRGQAERYYRPYFSRHVTFYTSAHTLYLWVAAFFLAPSPISLPASYFLLISALLAIGFFLRDSLQYERRLSRFLSALAALLGCVLWTSFATDWQQGLNESFWLAGLPGLFHTRKFSARRTSWLEPLFAHPEGAVIITFALFCGMGAMLLSLPLSAADGRSFNLIDSAFTAVSAVCVTGLTVLDTVDDFSLFGQLTILLLIQLGGLGIMSVSSFTILMVRQKRLSMQQERALSSVIGQRSQGEFAETVKQVVRVTLAIEFVGALLLTLLFYQNGFSFLKALWHGVFTAVSAFCNAGFALHSESLIPYQQQGFILHTIAALVIMGGLSPAFVLFLPNFRRWPNVSLQYKFVLIANIVLLLSGMASIALIEWRGALQHLSFLDKINNAWFQSVTTRTAGFNSVSMLELNSASLFIMMALMYIGGSPGGTAGGIKTTTLMVFWSSVVSCAFGRDHVAAFSRRIPTATTIRAATIVALSLAVCFVSLIGILISQQHITPVEALFEVLSAHGTVGLSLNTTPRLDSIGKVMIMICMFLGRVGSYSMLLYLAHSQTKMRWTLSEEDVVVT